MSDEQKQQNDTIAADNSKAREAQAISLERQTQQLQSQSAEQDVMGGRALRAPKGRRLLLAATGEQGVSSTLGG